MKLMFCTICGDVVSPGLVDLTPRWCHCGRHAVWWIDGGKGTIRVYDTSSVNTAAYLLGLHNGTLLTATRDWPLTPELVKIILDATPESYLFKKQNSLVVRFKPGETSDSAWAVHLP